MENYKGNPPVISFGGTNTAPGVDAEAWNRYNKWVTEVYYPLVNIKSPFTLGIDRYQIINESPEYSFHVTITHFPDLKNREDFSKSLEIKAVYEEYSKWVERHVIDYVFVNTYELLKSFRNDEAQGKSKTGTMTNNAPIMHIEGYRLAPEDQEKYSRWLEDYGFRIFLPLFMKIHGLRGFDFYRDSGNRLPLSVRDSEFPQYLSIVYFEDINSFENYRKSPELIAFQKAIRDVFPNGPNLKLYVQYQLTQSWRK